MAKPKRMVQEYLPGTAPEKNPKVHKQAMIALDLKDEAKLATKKAKEAGDELIRIMHEQGVEAYEYGDLNVRIDLKSTAKVKKVVAEKIKKPRKKKGDLSVEASELAPE